MNSASTSKRQVEADVICISGAISSCENCAKWQSALYLLQSMEEASMKPNLVAQNAALSACEKAKRWQNALALLEQLPKKA